MFMCTAEAPEKPAPDSAIACIITAASCDAEARAAELLRHGDAEPAVLGDRLVEVGREAALVVALQPVLVGKRVQSFAIASRMRCCSSVREKSILSSCAGSAARRRWRSGSAATRWRGSCAARPTEVAEVAGEEQQPHHDQHDRPDDAIASLCHSQPAQPARRRLLTSRRSRRRRSRARPGSRASARRASACRGGSAAAPPLAHTGNAAKPCWTPRCAPRAADVCAASPGRDAKIHRHVVLLAAGGSIHRRCGS